MGINNDLERIRNFSRRQNDTFFNREKYTSQISEILTEKIGEKEENNRQLRNSLHNDNLLPDSKQRLILEIIGEEEFDIDNIKITKEELERINDNKALILEIIGEEKICSYDLINWGEGLSEITKEELERINDNKALILEIIGEEKIHSYELINRGKELSEITKEKLERINDNKALILEILSGEIEILNLKELSEISEEGRKNINKNKKLIQEIVGDFGEQIAVRMTDLKELSEINRKQFEDIKKSKELIQENIGRKIHIRDLKYLSKITEEGRKKIKIIRQNIGAPIIPLHSDIVRDGLFDSEFGNHKGYGEYLSKLDKETIDYCKIHDIKKLRMIVMADRIMKNSSKVRGYVKRKQEYLENNRLLNDSEFENLFGGAGKYGKGEINQTGLGYCYLYTAYELLKKMNFFEVLIKTNMKKNESGDGWYIRLPMGQPDGQWIGVSKDEIDKKFDVTNKEGLIKRVSINSDSPLGFKIMEIAYIKKELINLDKNISQEFLDNGDILLTWERLSRLEGGKTQSALSVLMGDDNIINRNSNVSKLINGDTCIDIAFDNFGKGLIVDLGVRLERNPSNEVKLDIHGEIDTEKIEKDVRIINKYKNIPIIKSGFIKKDDNFKLIYGENRSNDMLSDIIEIDDKKGVVFYRAHAYSLERCYIDKDTGEKRVWIVNPWHTGIKFDISLERAKRIFDWSVSYIDVDKLFR